LKRGEKTRPWLVMRCSQH